MQTEEVLVSLDELKGIVNIDAERWLLKYGQEQSYMI